MNKKAIDVVLLPSADMIDKAIAINRYLLQKGEANMVLNKTDCLPHISVLMGCIADKELPQACRLINEIATQYSFFHLQITEVQQEAGSTVLNIQNSNLLQGLHLSIVEKLKPLLTFDAEAEMLYNPPQVSMNSLKYINNFLNNASYARYSPHITVGNGVYSHGEFPIPFTAATLAICHLGSHCTCRQILYEVILSDSKIS